MSRVTRSRSAKVPLAEVDAPTAQPKISEAFPTQKKRSRNDVKKLIESTTTQPAPARARSRSRTRNIKEEVKLEAEELTPVLCKPDLSQILRAPESTGSTSPPPSKTRKTPVTSPVNKPSAARALLFDDANDDTKVASIPEKPTISPIAILTAAKKTEPKIRNVAQLQARLAEKSALRKLHQQNVAGKSKQVEEHAQFLKSPKKQAPLSSSVASSSAEIALPIPKFVLPTHRTPVKQPNSDDEAEERERQNTLRFTGMASRLVDEVKRSGELSLPEKYQFLADQFRTCDRIVSMLYARSTRIPFKDVQKNVEQNFKRDFKLDRMAQILTVYPQSYEVRLEEQREIFGKVIPGKYEYFITPNVKTDLDGYMLPETSEPIMEQPLPLVTPGKCLSPMKSPKKKCTVIPRAPELDSAPKLEGWRIQCRHMVMKHILLQMVIQEYKRATGMAEDAELPRRPHPKIWAELVLPDIAPTKLPEPPKLEGEKFTMKDFMQSVGTEARIPNAVEDALRELKSPVKAETSKSGLPLSPKKFAQSQAGKPSLLERIRMKEAARKATQALRDPVKEEKLAKIDNLIAKSILDRLLCYQAQKGFKSVEFTGLITKLDDSASYNCKVDKKVLISCVEYLCEIAPYAFAIAAEMRHRYFKFLDIDRKMIMATLKEEQEKLRAIKVSMPRAP